MGTVRVILSCSAIFSLTIMDGFGVPLGSWRKGRKRKSRFARRRANKKKSLPSPLFVFPPSFGRRRRGVLLLPMPTALALARPRSPSSAAHPPPPRRGRRSRHRSPPSPSARRPICPNNDSDSDPIMCGERKGRQTGEKELPPSFLAGSVLFTLWGFLCHCQAEFLL